MRGEVVIVGGGPAGLYAASKLGNRCLVFEKGEPIQRKPCGGLMTPYVQKTLRQMGWTGEGSLLYQDLHLYFGNDRCRVAHYPYNLAEIVPRETLISFLRDKAIEAGAKIFNFAKIVQIDFAKKEVLVRRNDGKESIRYTHLIGADGAGGIVARSLDQRMGFQRPRRFIRTLSYRVFRPDFTELATGWSSEYGPNYVWAFRAKPFVDIGVCGPDEQHLEAMLNLWANRLGITLPSSSPEKWIVPYQYRGVCHPEDVYLVGDAAGVGVGLTGEGIRQTLMSVNCAIESIRGSMSTRPIERKILTQKRVQETVLGLRSSSNRFLDWSNDFLYRISGTETGKRFCAWFFGMSNV